MKRSNSTEAKSTIKKSKTNNFSKPDDSIKHPKKSSTIKGFKTENKSKNVKGKQVSHNVSEMKMEKKESLKKKKFMQNKKKKIAGAFPDKLIGKDGKPKWVELKEEKKKLKEKRKLQRTGADQYELSVKAKAIWEKLRECTVRTKRKKEQGQKENKSDREEKEALVNELYTMLKGQVPNIIQSHDMTRVIQWMLKLGSASVRSNICDELCADTVLYLKSKYASFCILRALKYGSRNDRNNIIQSCYSHFTTLLKFSYAIPVLETMYDMYATVDQRRRMHVELYGEMHALLPPDVCRIEDAPADVKAAITASTKNILIKLVAKKQLLQTTYFQSILNDFLTSCSGQDCNDILELIQGDVIEFLNSKEGKRVALRIIWLATNKMKKVIVKSMKTKVKDIAMSEEGHMMLMALFDCVDDTVLVNKALISELLENIEEIVKNESGRKVVLYLVAHRDPAYFHPQVIDILSKGDNIGSRKKDNEIRKQELLKGVSEPLLKLVASDPGLWLRDSSLAMVSLAILKSGKGEPLKDAFESVISFLLDPDNVLEEKSRQIHVVESSALHIVLKKLIQMEQTDQTTETFSSIFISRLSEENLNHILQYNRGCFLVVLILESSQKNFQRLKSKITPSMLSFLKGQETTGSKILLKKINV